jgi:C4-dicarboxylate-specific signal transduction histidine kinase
VGLAIIVPLVANVAMNQLALLGMLRIPICATLLFLGTLAVIGYELGRELIINSRARMQLTDLRHEWAQVERVNSLGQLASALAHELSQPLAAILMNVDAARQQLRNADPDLEELRATLEDTHKDGLRAAAIIDRIRTFIKTRSMAAQSFGLEEVAQDVTSLLRHEATVRRVELKSSLPAGLPAAFGDRVHISQVILNLLINAMDAVQDCSAAERQVSLEVCTGDRDTLRITVRDCGPGIPEERLEEIFNPLVTTKPTGLGVGLALSRMIVDAHGGTLWAENGATGGAVFHFTLPQGPRIAQ